MPAPDANGVVLRDVCVSAETGSVSPFNPVTVVSPFGWNAKPVSVAVRMIGRAPGRNPAPPMLPDAGRTLPLGSTVNDPNDGTSPLAPGVNCVDTRPAAPLSSVVPLLFPSKPRPVAI